MSFSNSFVFLFLDIGIALAILISSGNIPVLNYKLWMCIMGSVMLLMIYLIQYIFIS